jgi:hypothetical protein
MVIAVASQTHVAVGLHGQKRHSVNAQKICCHLFDVPD